MRITGIVVSTVRIYRNSSLPSFHLLWDFDEVLLVLICSIVIQAGFITLLIASSVLTWQTTRLKRQISNDVRRSALGPATSTGSGNIYSISLSEVSLGRTVIGLTWTAVVMMLGCAALWVLSLFEGRKERRNLKHEKGERFSESDRGV